MTTPTERAIQRGINANFSVAWADIPAVDLASVIATFVDNCQDSDGDWDRDNCEELAQMLHAMADQRELHRTCASCDFVFAETRTECPFCGHEHDG